MNDNFMMVTAPLKIQDMDKNLASEIVYVFDYNNSTLKNNEFMEYVQQLGCISDICFTQDTLFEEKETILLHYLTNTTSLKYYHLLETWIDILFYYKKIDIKIENSLFTKNDIEHFISKHETFIKEQIRFYDSLFVLMLCNLNNKNGLFYTKSKYSKDKIVDDYISPNIINVLYLKDFYNYYKNGVNEDNTLFYQNVFNNSFEKVLTNSSNEIWKSLVDLSNPHFLDFLKDKGFTYS